MNNEYGEMLERAARGAGYRYYDIENEELHIDKFTTKCGWDPMDNDGDAFRLMIKCGMTVFATEDWCARYDVGVSSRQIHMTGADWNEDTFNDDWNAMIRYAIVDHAAQLGELRDH